MTPVNMFGGTDDLSDILRNSPNMDFSKLQIKQERVSEKQRLHDPLFLNVDSEIQKPLNRTDNSPIPGHLSIRTLFLCPIAAYK